MSTVQPPLTIERIQKLVEELRSAYADLLGGDSIAAPALIRAIVAEWSSVVLPAIDARIAKCHELIKRGLRDEAMGYAEEPPNLLEAVKQLDLERFGSEYSRWVEASHVAGLLLPQAPQLDKVADIEAALERVAELRPLLERWRRLNVQRAPLSTRIRMLQEILAQDPNNPVWHEMLADHERHRLMEIKAGIARLRERSATHPDMDVGGVERDIDRLLTELRGEWRTLQPPENLFHEATLLGAEIRQRRIDATLDGLVVLLQAAYERLNVDRTAAKAILARHFDDWKTALADRGVIDPADPRLARVKSILEYVECVRTHESHLSEVAQRLAERPHSLRKRISWSHDLDAMMDLVDDTATRLPTEDVDARRISELSDRVARVAESVGRELSTRRLMRVGAVAAVIIGIAAGSWATYSLRQHASGVRGAVEQCIAALKDIEAGAIDDARLGDAWTKAVRRHPDVTRAMQTLAEARAAREVRREALAQQLDEIRAAIVELRTADRPDPLTPWPASFGLAAKLLADVREQKLATVDEERAKLEQPAATLRTKSKEFIDAADDAFEHRVHRLEADLAAAEIELNDDPGKADATIAKAAADLEGLRSLAGTAACPGGGDDYGLKKLVSPASAALVSADSKATSKLNALRARRAVIAGLADREERADRLLDAGKYAAYADAIREIARDMGPSPTARDYTAVADNHAAWQAIADWSHVVDDLKNPTQVTGEEASAMLETLRGLGPSVKLLPDARDAVSWLVPALERSRTKTADQLRTLREEFAKRLDGTYGEKLDGVVTMKEAPDYARYYCLLKDRPLPDTNKRFSYVTGLPDAAREWPKKQLSFDPVEYRVTDSPQKRLAVICKRIVDRHAATEPDAIDEVALEVLQACAVPPPPPAGDLSIDPCLHALLLRFLIDHACKELPTLADGLKNSLAIINCGNEPKGTPIMIKGVDNEVFSAVLDPDQQNAGAWVQTQRRKCADFIERAAADIDATIQTNARQKKDLNSKYRDLRQFRCVGRLKRAPGGGWTIGGGDSAVRAGKQLFKPGGPRDNFTMTPCVTCDANGAIPPGMDVKARGGEPIYIEIRNDRKG